MESLSNFFAPLFGLGTDGPSWTKGTGSPEGVVTAPVGSFYSRTDGATNTATYRKESGTGNTGWVADSATAAGGGVSGGVTVTVPQLIRGAGASEHRETVALAGVTPSSRIALSFASHTDDDENDPELLDVTMLAASAGTDAFDVILTFANPTSGPIKLNYQVT